MEKHILLDRNSSWPESRRSEFRFWLSHQGFGSVINLHCGFMQVSHHLSLFKVELLISADHIYGVRTKYGGH